MVTRHTGYWTKIGLLLCVGVISVSFLTSCNQTRRSEGQAPEVEFDAKGELKTPVDVESVTQDDIDNEEHLLPKEEFVGGIMPDERKAQKLVNQLSNYTMALCSDNLECPEDLDALRKAMKEVYKLNWPNDPWGNPYAYTRVGTDKFEIISWGPDKTPGTEDDVKISERNR